MKKQPVDPRTNCRAKAPLLKERSLCSTTPEVTGIVVNSATEVIVSIDIAVTTTDTPMRAQRDFSSAQIRDLSELAYSSTCPDVQRAATAVLEFARGKSYSDCAEGTPYGEGWVRALITAFRNGGVEALKNRKYRRPRQKG